MQTAQDNGAEFLGFVFYDPSPRNISFEAAAELGKISAAKKVAVTVDADDELLTQIISSLQPDYIQLHGSETEERAEEIKSKFNVALIKAANPNYQSSIISHQLYDYLLIDSPKDELPGGNGKTFDWNNFTPPTKDWFLSGGLNISNIEQAIKATGASMVDISSGVEAQRGVKDLGLIKQFLEKVNEL